MLIVNNYLRYQVGLTFNQLFPSIKNTCACGCGSILPKNRKKWGSDECRQTSYISFAIIKGDNSTIRMELFKRDNGGCLHCGLISDDWESDHIRPVSLGGSACDLSNFQTLCKDCHRLKTANYNLPHQSAISSQAASIFLSRCLYEVGQHSICCLNKSYEKHSFKLAASPDPLIYLSAY